MTTMSTASFISNDNEGSWLLGSFDPKFNMIDSINLQDDGGTGVLKVSNGCYIIGIYYIQKYNLFELTNTLYISDVSQIPTTPFQVMNSGGITDKGYNLKAVAALNKKWGLLDLSSDQVASGVINLVLCGNISKFVRAGVPLPPDVSTTSCPNGYIFGDSANNFCVGSNVVTVVANNYITGFTPKSSLLGKLGITLPSGVSVTSSNSSLSNIVIIIAIILFIIACIAVALYVRKHYFKKTNY